MSSQRIRDIVARCYGGFIVNQRSNLDQDNVRSAASTGPLSPQQPVGQNVVPPSGSEVIRGIVARCYTGAIPNQPNTLDQVSVPQRQAVTPPPPTPSPNQVIQQLVGRCYPDLGLTSFTEFVPEVVDSGAINVDLSEIVDFINPLVGNPFDFTGDITVQPPQPPTGKTWVTIGKPENDCVEVAELDARGLLNQIEKGKYQHVKTGVIYYCDDADMPVDLKWERCVREAQECMMRPYMGGQWTPPKADCDDYQMTGWSSNKSEICIKNCFPTRLPVYEHRLNSGGINVRMNHRNQNGMWAGTVQTTDQYGQWTNRKVFNEGGAQIFSNNTTQSFTTSNSGITVNVSVTPIDDGNDWDSEWWISSWTGTAPVGTTWTYSFNVGNSTAFLDFEVVGEKEGDHLYLNSNESPSGYTLTQSEPAFHVLKDPIQGKTVPIYSFYSSSNTDSILTTNPGAPDGPGNGERQYLNDNGYVFQSVIGHAFLRKDMSIGYGRKKGDKVQALVRQFAQTNFDHMASIDAEIPEKPPERHEKRNSYRIPKNPRQNLRIIIDCEHGYAAYNNSLGFYLANSNGPVRGYIVVPESKSNKPEESITISTQYLEQYAGGTMGFFIIPNGAGVQSLSRGQQVDFEALNSPYEGGFRGTGILSSQNNYCLFSDNRWNPFDTDQTKWIGSGHQLWEDLINGDNDYNDLKFYHKVEWWEGEPTFDGVIGYVYENAAPPRITRKVSQDRACDDRSTQKGFQDIVLQRNDCGSMVVTVDGNGNDYECGTCLGGYGNKLNQSQTLEIINPSTLVFVSGGGITGGLQGECTKFKIRVKKNSVTVYEKIWEAQYWPPIGEALTDEISLTSGDTLTFEVPEIISGGPNTSISPAVSLFNSTASSYDGQFTINLITANIDDKIQETTGAPAINTLNATTVTDGRIKGLQMQYSPSAKGLNEWMAGSYKTDSYFISADDSTNGFTATQVWSNNAAVPMPSVTAQSVANHPGNANNSDARGTNVDMLWMPNNFDGYIDTGMLPEGVTGYQTSDIEDVISEMCGNYNHLLEEHLVTALNFHPSYAYDQIASASQDLLREKLPFTAARGAWPWHMVNAGLEKVGGQFQGVDINYKNIISQSWHNNPWQSPITFVHDYILTGGVAEDSGMTSTPAKVRVSFTFYSLMATSADRGVSSNSYYWQCLIRVMDVIDRGNGYQNGMEFDLFWPPVRATAGEKTNRTPYFPDYRNGFQHPEQNLLAYYEEAKNVDRYSKEAIYQESHLVDSPIWYYTTDRKEYRVRFKLIINDVE